MLRWVSRWTMALAFILGPVAEASPETLTLRGAEAVSLLSKATWAREAPGLAPKSLETARLDEAEGRFTPLGADSLRLGVMRGALWIHARVLNESDENSVWVLQGSRDKVEALLTVQCPSGQREHRWSSLAKATQRDLPFPMLAWIVELPRHEVCELWIRSESVLPLTHLSLEPLRANIAWKMAESRLALGGLGLAGFLVVLQMVSILATRKPVLLAFGFYSLATLVSRLAISGYGFVHVWPDFPRLNQVLGVAGTLSEALGAVAFFGVFLKARKSRVVKALGMFSVGISVAGLATVVASGRSPLSVYFSYVAGVVALSFIGVSAASAWRRGARGDAALAVGSLLPYGYTGIETILIHLGLVDRFFDGAGFLFLGFSGQVGILIFAVGRQLWAMERRLQEARIEELGAVALQVGDKLNSPLQVVLQSVEELDDLLRDCPQNVQKSVADELRRVRRQVELIEADLAPLYEFKTFARAISALRRRDRFGSGKTALKLLKERD